MFPSLDEFEQQFADFKEGDYRLAPTSRWKGAASDGLDLGAAVDALTGVLQEGRGRLERPQPGAFHPGRREQWSVRPHGLRLQADSFRRRVHHEGVHARAEFDSQLQVRPAHDRGTLGVHVDVVEPAVAERRPGAQVFATRDSPDLTGRDERRVLDFARAASDVPQADIVLLHRVICCYPDMETLVGAAADHAGRLLALSFPADRWWWHIGRVLTNMWFRLRGCAFRLYLHHPHRILEVAEHAGLRPIMQRRGWIWQIAVLERTNAGNQSAE